MIDASVTYMLKNFLNDQKVANHTLFYNTLDANGGMARKYKMIHIDGMNYLAIGLMYSMKASVPLTIIDYYKNLRYDQFFTALARQADGFFVLFHEGLN